MSENILNELDEFLWNKSHSNDFLKRVAESNQTISQQISLNLQGVHETLDKQLKEGIESCLPRLLEQVPELQTLEDSLRSVQLTINSLSSESKRISQQCSTLDSKLEELIKTKENDIFRKNLATDVQLCQDLFESLEKRTDMLKKSEIISEINELLKENPDLKNVKWLNNIINKNLSVMENDVRRNASQELKHGLSSLNNSLVTLSQRALKNLNCLDSELEIIMSSWIVEIDKGLMKLSTAQDSAINKTLPSVVSQIQSHLEQSMMLGNEFNKKFSEKMARTIKSRIPSDAKYALRFVQHTEKFFKNKCYNNPILLDSLKPFKNAYLSQALANLNAIIEEHDFTTTHTNPFVDLIDCAFQKELKRVSWDSEFQSRLDEILKKSLDTVSKKIETNLHLQKSDLLFGDRLTNNQLINYCLLQTTDSIIKKWPKLSNSVKCIQQDTINVFVDEITTAIDSILIRMHSEIRENGKKAPYLVELLEYMNHVDMHIAHIKRSMPNCNILSKTSDHLMDAFILNASLIRCCEDDIKEYIISDFEEIIESMISMSWPLKYNREIVNIFRNAEQLIENKLLESSIKIQILVSLSPKELIMPYESVGWTVDEYIKWYNKCEEREVLSLLNGLMTTYKSSVITEKHENFVVNYPLIMKLLEESFA